MCLIATSKSLLTWISIFNIIIYTYKKVLWHWGKFVFHNRLLHLWFSEFFLTFVHANYDFLQVQKDFTLYRFYYLHTHTGNSVDKFQLLINNLTISITDQREPTLKNSFCSFPVNTKKINFIEFKVQPLTW